jgi:hypothetical protein
MKFPSKKILKEISLSIKNSLMKFFIKKKLPKEILSKQAFFYIKKKILYKNFIKKKNLIKKKNFFQNYANLVIQETHPIDEGYNL